MVIREHLEATFFWVENGALRRSSVFRLQEDAPRQPDSPPEDSPQLHLTPVHCAGDGARAFRQQSAAKENKWQSRPWDNTKNESGYEDDRPKRRPHKPPPPCSAFPLLVLAFVPLLKSMAWASLPQFPPLLF